ncbi:MULTISPECIES: IclR family transcriptional regulator [Rhodococcus]|uniref:IclR family transcriptional regulator n=1 Tax=Rhodococcus TaxID=1827 RepID=UPI001FD431B5|nr:MULTISPECIES: IclR family transcriptional regulator [Rhodococcus]
MPGGARSITTASKADGPPTPPSMIARMTLILSVFDDQSALLSLEEVARRTNLPRSSTHRILDQMVQAEWIDHGPDGYRLGPLGLGKRTVDDVERKAAFQNEIRAAAADLLHQLYLRTGMVVHLAVWDNGSEVFVDKIGGHYASELQIKVGHRVPAHHTTGGRAMLACLPAEQVDRHLRRRFARVGGNAGWDMRSLHAELNRIRQRQGLSFESGASSERLTGQALPSIAAAVRGPHGPVAAICLCGGQNLDALHRAWPLVRDVANRISRKLFPDATTAQASD